MVNTTPFFCAWCVDTGAHYHDTAGVLVRLPEVTAEEALKVREFLSLAPMVVPAAVKPAPVYPTPAPGIGNLTTTLPGHPLAQLAYTLSEPHLSGHRVILGFATRTEAYAAHDWLLAKIKQATIAEPCEVKELAERLAGINRKFYGGGNQDYLDAIEMLVDCSDSIVALGEQMARQIDEIQRQAKIITRARAMAPLVFHVMEKHE